MNKKTSLSAGARRFQQIKTVSRAAKWLAWVFLAFTGGFMLLLCGQSVATRFQNGVVVSSSAPPTDGVAICHHVATLGFQLILCAWYWKLSRLFRCYEQGKIFAAETIGCIKVLGGLYFLGGVLTTILHLLPKPARPVLPPGVTVTLTHTHTYSMGFFKFDFGTGIDFGLLLAGALIVLIAWIMDEGRKIQEEQALTV